MRLPLLARVREWLSLAELVVYLAARRLSRTD